MENLLSDIFLHVVQHVSAYFDLALTSMTSKRGGLLRN